LSSRNTLCIFLYLQKIYFVFDRLKVGFYQVNDGTNRCNNNRCIFLELHQINLYVFRALLCPSSGDKKTRLVNISCEATWLCWLQLHGAVVRLQSNNSFLKVHTAHIAAPYNCSQHNQVASHEMLTSLVFLSPDDGHNNARNM
jgi:hypothetical protein